MGSGFQYRRSADPVADEPGRQPLRQTFHGTQRLKPAARISRIHPATLPAVRGWRYLRLALHTGWGLLTVFAIYPLTGADTHRRLRQRWSGQLLALLGIEVHSNGTPIQPGCMLVANHISWLDIFVINALCPSAFVSKAEVRAWPLIGWLAAKNETVFLRRGSRGHAKIINAEIAALLDAGRNVAVFPEGTTTDGSHVLHFHAALLQPAIEAGHPIQPVAISYHAPDGRRSRAPAYDGDLSIGQCIANIVAEKSLVARLGPSTPLETKLANRKDLARNAHRAIMSLIEHDDSASIAAPFTRQQCTARSTNHTV
jgi:1-acyl-sn-glycerol-3-phosphate acyltransferase